jgi:hypothetical protein
LVEIFIFKPVLIGLLAGLLDRFLDDRCRRWRFFGYNAMLAEDVVPGKSVLAIATVPRLFGIIPFSICVGIIHRDVD